MPDAGLISYGELVEQGRNICRAVTIPLIGDGDTGFGSAQNIKRTVQGYADAGFACIMLEDQVAPKRCGHTEGKSVVPREEALMRIRAAVDARDHLRQSADGRAPLDILIMARTDAHAEMIIAAGVKAASEGGYEEPAWLSPASAEPAPAGVGVECEGELCTDVSVTEPPAPAVTKTTTSGCSTSGGSRSGGDGVAGLALGLAALCIAARRRKG